MASAYDEWLLRMLLQYGEKVIPLTHNWRERELLKRAEKIDHARYGYVHGGVSGFVLTEAARDYITRSMGNGN